MVNMAHIKAKPLDASVRSNNLQDSPAPLKIGFLPGAHEVFKEQDKTVRSKIMAVLREQTSEVMVEFRKHTIMSDDNIYKIKADYDFAFKVEDFRQKAIDIIMDDVKELPDTKYFGCRCEFTAYVTEVKFLKEVDLKHYLKFSEHLKKKEGGHGKL
jgi:hypothetical protein